jgi:hypothetical protein
VESLKTAVETLTTEVRELKTSISTNINMLKELSNSWLLLSSARNVDVSR